MEDAKTAARIARALTGNEVEIRRRGREWAVRELALPGVELIVRTRDDDMYEAFLEDSSAPFSQGKIDDLLARETRIGTILNISDEALFRSALDVPEGEHINETHLTEGLLRLPVSEAEAGLDSASVTHAILLDASLYIEVTAHISDPERLTRAARSAYLDCWGDDEWLPSGPCEAIFELALASNANPSPDEMGFEFVALFDKHDDADRALVRYAADRAVRMEPDLVSSPDEGYEAWLERTGRDDSFTGNERAPGTRGLFEAGRRAGRSGLTPDAPEP